MNIVVVKNKVDYSGSFLKVSTLDEACQIVGTIDVLVYNNSNESKDKKIESLGILKEKAKKLIYICNEKDTDLAVKMMIIGSEGKYFDDEFFLESGYELNNLIGSLDEVTALANLGGVNVLSDFFNRYLKNGSSDFNSNYLMVVKEAVNELMVEYNQKNLEIIQMSETATDIFSNTSALLASMKTERESLEKIVEKISSNAKEVSSQVSKRHVGSSVFFFPRIDYMKEKSILRIKEIGNTSFLISFSLGLRLYLENVKNVRPKLIVIEPVGYLYEEMYKDFAWVKSSNSKTLSNYYNDVVFTNCPSKDVLNKLLDDSKYDTFIVVDRTTSDKDHILNCKGGTVKYLVSGSGSIDRFRLPKKDCFSSVVNIPGCMFHIPLFQDYQDKKFMRERRYLSDVGVLYDKLLLDLRRRR